ncbi:MULTISPECIES: hypothetical protein [Streptomycetaceae]|uniref:hypothetical protein n=1 Tax=Streptomycetaceae TaxID=2062 RepID=UPI000364F184|nr:MULTISPECIES: hypothetical protein [Streptomycetaceae]MYX39193.1 hypothetical protein [Streptomyces sp. SID8377]
MAHTKHRKQSTRPTRGAARSGRRTLRRESPTTVALLTDPADFAAMRGYRSFTFDDHATYLRQIEGLLRSLASRGVHVRVGPFDPDEYADYCAGTGHDPDSSRSRTRYAADVTTTGPTVPYTGQPLALLVTELEYETGRQATWERASGILADAGDCSGCGDDLARTSFDRASQALMRLLEAAGPGHHHLVCSVPAEGTTLLAAMHARCDEQGMVHLAEAEALVCCTVLAAGFAEDSPGGLVLRSGAGAGAPPPDRPDEVRGWTLRDGWLQPLTEAQVFNAYCTDAESGDPVPPEPGVVHRPGFVLPPPEDD